MDGLGIASIALSGGEPTLHPDYLTVIKMAARRGIYVATATNGWRFAELDELKKAVDAGLRYVEVSVDSASMKKHDRFRGVDGSWTRAVRT
ncbi:MAG: radical SAM protein, partial [Ignisphaera sp.]